MNQEQVHPEAAASRPLVVRAVLRTDVGRVRSENQDYVACTTADEESAAGMAGRLLVVADGMGGHRGGATASRLAAETLKSEYLGSASGDITRVLHEALERANACVWSEAQRNSDLRGMGTTTSALVVRGSEAWFGHIGDSRIYMIRNGEATQLTDDHSLVATLVREGLLSPAEAENHPRRNVLQRSLGVASEVESDVRGPFPITEGDVFILCSDGLHGLVKPAEMIEVAQLPIEAAADEFLKRSLERGAPDNVTVIVARIEADDAPHAPAGGDRFDETQPFDESDVDSSLFDETIVDGSKRPSVPGVPRVKAAPASDAPAASVEPVAVSPSTPVRDASPRSGISLWALLLLLLLSVGAAWFVMSRIGHREMPSSAPSSR